MSNLKYIIGSVLSSVILYNSDLNAQTVKAGSVDKTITSVATVDSLRFERTRLDSLIKEEESRVKSITKEDSLRITKEDSLRFEKLKLLEQSINNKTDSLFVYASSDSSGITVNLNQSKGTLADLLKLTNLGTRATDLERLNEQQNFVADLYKRTANVNLDPNYIHFYAGADNIITDVRYDRTRTDAVAGTFRKTEIDSLKLILDKINDKTVISRADSRTLKQNAEHDGLLAKWLRGLTWSGKGSIGKVSDSVDPSTIYIGNINVSKSEVKIGSARPGKEIQYVSAVITSYVDENGTPIKPKSKKEGNIFDRTGHLVLPKGFTAYLSLDDLADESYEDFHGIYNGPERKEKSSYNERLNHAEQGIISIKDKVNVQDSRIDSVRNELSERTHPEIRIIESKKPNIGLGFGVSYQNEMTSPEFRFSAGRYGVGANYGRRNSSGPVITTEANFGNVTYQGQRQEFNDAKKTDLFGILKLNGNDSGFYLGTGVSINKEAERQEGSERQYINGRLDQERSIISLISNEQKFYPLIKAGVIFKPKNGVAGYYIDLSATIRPGNIKDKISTGAGISFYPGSRK